MLQVPDLPRIVPRQSLAGRRPAAVRSGSPAADSSLHLPSKLDEAFEQVVRRITSAKLHAENRLGLTAATYSRSYAPPQGPVFRLHAQFTSICNELSRMRVDQANVGLMAGSTYQLAAATATSKNTVLLPMIPLEHHDIVTMIYENFVMAMHELSTSLSSVLDFLMFCEAHISSEAIANAAEERLAGAATAAALDASSGSSAPSKEATEGRKRAAIAAKVTATQVSNYVKSGRNGNGRVIADTILQASWREGQSNDNADVDEDGYLRLSLKSKKTLTSSSTATAASSSASSASATSGTVRMRPSPDSSSASASSSTSVSLSPHTSVEQDLKATGFATRIFLEFAEYVQAVITLAAEVVTGDAQVLAEGMAKRRIAGPLTREQMAAVCAGQYSGSAASAPDRKAGSAGKRGDGLRRRRNAGGAADADQANSVQEMLDAAASGKKKVTHGDYTPIGGEDDERNDSEDGGNDGSDGDNSDCDKEDGSDEPASFEWTLGWQQLLIVRSRLLARRRGIAGLLEDHADYIYSCIDFAVGPTLSQRFRNIVGANVTIGQIDKHAFQSLQASFTKSESRCFDLPLAEDFDPARRLLNHLFDKYGATWNAVNAVFRSARGPAGKVAMYASPEFVNKDGSIASAPAVRERAPAAGGDDSETTPLLSTEEGGAAASGSASNSDGPAARGYQPLHDGDDDHEDANANIDVNEAAAIAVQRSQRSSSSSTAGLQPGHTPASDILRYIDIGPVADAFEALSTASKAGFARLATPLTEKPADVANTSAMLYAASAELIHRMGTLRARIAAVVSQKDVTAGWIQPPLGLPNLTSMPAAVAVLAAEQASTGGDAPSSSDGGGGSSASGGSRSREKEWESREEESEMAQARKKLNFGEAPVAEPARPPVAAAAAGTADSSAVASASSTSAAAAAAATPLSGNAADPYLAAAFHPSHRPTAIPLTESESMAISLLAERSLKESAERLQNMVSYNSVSYPYCACFRKARRRSS